MDFDLIRAKNKIFLDTGGSFRVAGHDIRITHEEVIPDIPQWFSEYMYKLKTKYAVEDMSQIKNLHNQLLKLEYVDNGQKTVVKKEIPEQANTAKVEAKVKKPKGEEKKEPELVADFFPMNDDDGKPLNDIGKKVDDL